MYSAYLKRYWKHRCLENQKSHLHRTMYVFCTIYEMEWKKGMTLWRNGRYMMWIMAERASYLLAIFQILKEWKSIHPFARVGTIFGDCIYWLLHTLTDVYNCILTVSRKLYFFFILFSICSYTTAFFII